MLAIAAPADADPWLFVSDVHFAPDMHQSYFSTSGADTDAVLLESAIATMQHASPHPPVVVLAGDFLAHNFNGKRAASTMAYLAKRFNAAFPQAQFILVLGNNDSDCGDYGVEPNSAFLGSVAKAWAPLVDRNGAAPDFIRTFPHNGAYLARLPLAGIRAVIVNDVLWSPRYRPGCARASKSEVSPAAELERAFSGARRERTWVFMHIPPGIDAYSTAHLAHRLLVVPWLDPGPRDLLLSLADPKNRVELFVAGHTHKFAYRIIDPASGPPVPMLLIPSVSPVFGNAPSFLTVDIDAQGTVGNIAEFSERGGRWGRIGDLRTLGVATFSGPALHKLQSRLESDPGLRARFNTMYGGGARSEIDDSNWRVYWCAAQTFTATAFRGCMHEGGVSLFTRRGIFFIAAGALGTLLIIVLLVTLSVRWARRGRAA